MCDNNYNSSSVNNFSGISFIGKDTNFNYYFPISNKNNKIENNVLYVTDNKHIEILNNFKNNNEIKNFIERIINSPIMKFVTNTINKEIILKEINSAISIYEKINNF